MKFYYVRKQFQKANIADRFRSPKRTVKIQALNLCLWLAGQCFIYQIIITVTRLLNLLTRLQDSFYHGRTNKSLLNKDTSEIDHPLISWTRQYTIFINSTSTETSFIKPYLIYTNSIKRKVCSPIGSIVYCATVDTILQLLPFFPTIYVTGELNKRNDHNKFDEIIIQNG